MNFDSTEKWEEAKKELKEVTIWEDVLKRMEDDFITKFPSVKLYD